MFNSKENQSSDVMEDKAFSSIDFVGQCLFDPEKAQAFKNVLQKTIKPNYNVLDVGTGSGIIALFSAEAGAKNVTALEFDPFVAKIAQENFKNNNKNIKVVMGDARTHTFEKGTQFDVITMEMLTSGMVDEMQVQAINNLHEQGVIKPSTIFIPKRQETYITLSNINFDLFGFNMKMVLHCWKFFQNIKVKDLTEKALLSSIDFSKKTPEVFDTTITLKATETGIINALWLSSSAVVDETELLENTKSLNPPVAIPLPNKKITSGEEIKVRVRYKFGYGYKNFSAEIL